MPELTIWIDKEMRKLKRDMDRLMYRLCNDFDMPVLPRVISKVPFINLLQTKDHLVVNAEIPGFNPENLDISINDGVLTIKGEMKQEVVKKGGKIEVRQESFSRNIPLPCRVMLDKVEATYTNGILNVFIPKYKPENAREVKIRIE
ncbi:MAG: Hsp20/alpha crystallin family protein [Deltaproteobacteria bacterium]|nr:Hsp20/alpha crystallin family protein [Deltaproteobacteria bacterium]MBW2010899.1 Hsp20/alpha crystallin family protein [Deltaproteobacteria bacterium]MBW2099283.1 Hsp20/alpha crystallin family protein [Deltaproteobacteria bacterium]